MKNIEAHKTKSLKSDGRQGKKIRVQTMIFGFKLLNIKTIDFSLNLDLPH